MIVWRTCYVKLENAVAVAACFRTGVLDILQAAFQTQNHVQHCEQRILRLTPLCCRIETSAIPNFFDLHASCEAPIDKVLRHAR